MEKHVIVLERVNDTYGAPFGMGMDGVRYTGQTGLCPVSRRCVRRMIP